MLPNAVHSKRQQKEVNRLNNSQPTRENLDLALEMERKISTRIRSRRIRSIVSAIVLLAVIAWLISGSTGCNAVTVPHLVNLQVETAPAQDIYFDGQLIGTGTTRIHMFSDLIPNYLEIRDVVTGETLSRILLHKIPNLQVLSLRYKTESARLKIIGDLIESENSINGQSEQLPETDPADQVNTGDTEY